MDFYTKIIISEKNLKTPEEIAIRTARAIQRAKQCLDAYNQNRRRIKYVK